MKITGLERNRNYVKTLKYIPQLYHNSQICSPHQSALASFTVDVLREMLLMHVTSKIKHIGKKAGLHSTIILALFVYSEPVLGACATEDMAAAENYVIELKQKADEILSKNEPPLTHLKIHLLNNLEFDPLAKFALGRYWNNANVKQRRQYLGLFKSTVSHTLASTVLLYKGSRIAIGKKISLGPRDILIRSRIIAASGEAQEIDWRIRFAQCRAIAVDLVKGGVSLLATKRQEFAAVVSREGIDGLLKSLTALEKMQLRKLEEVSGDNHDIREILNRMLLEAAEKFRQQGQQQGPIRKFFNSSLSLNRKDLST